MEIYEELKERGYTTSFRRYSRDWLGRAPNYVASNPNGFTLDTFVNLHDKLRQHGLDDLADKVICIVFDLPYPRETRS